MNTASSKWLIAAAPLLFVVLWATGFVVARLSAPHADPLSSGVRDRRPAVCRIAAAPVPHRRKAARFMRLWRSFPAWRLSRPSWAVHMHAGPVSALIVGLQPLMTPFRRPDRQGSDPPAD
jgi:hypothetical protein